MSDLIFKAIEFAAKAHRGQFRKTAPVPYIIHPIRVGCMLLEAGRPEEEAVAGFLHDTVEDTPVTLQDIEKEFGEKIAELVSAVSEPDKGASWEERKKHTVESLQTAAVEVLFITCADKLDNLLSMKEDRERHGEKVWDRFDREVRLMFSGSIS